MDTKHNSKYLERMLMSLEGVEDASVCYEMKIARVVGSVSAAHLMRKIKKLGYQPSIRHLVKTSKKNPLNAYRALLKKAFFPSALGIFLYVLEFFNLLPDLSGNYERFIWLIISWSTFGALFYAGGHIYHQGYLDFRLRNITNNLLVTAGTASAWLFSNLVLFFPNLVPTTAKYTYFEVTMCWIGFANICVALSANALIKRLNTLKKIEGLLPDFVKVIRDQEEKVVLLEHVQKDDIINIEKNQLIPVDGIVVSGNPKIGQSIFINKNHVDTKNQGDVIFSSEINLTAPFHLRVIRAKKHSLLFRFIDQLNKTRNAPFAEYALIKIIAKRFLYFVLLYSILAMSLWGHFGPEPKTAHMILSFISILIVSSIPIWPLCVSLPILQMTTKLSQIGILIRKIKVIPTLSRLSVLVIEDSDVHFPEAITYLKELQKFGIKVILFDNNKNGSNTVPEECFYKIIKNKSDIEKNIKISNLKEKMEKVGVVTNEKNEKGYASEADVCFSFGRINEKTDVFFLTKELIGIKSSIQAARSFRKITKINLYFLTIFFFTLIPISAGTLFPIGVAMINPVILCLLSLFCQLSIAINSHRIKLR